MTRDQIIFWRQVRDLAQSVRCGKRVALEVAADALALEQEIEERLADGMRMAAVAEDPKQEGR